MLGGLQSFDQIVNLTVESSRNVGARVADTVVGDPVLREVIGADLFRPVAGTDQCPSRITQLLGFGVDFHLQQPGAQHAHGFGLIFDLRFLILVSDDDPRRDVGNTDGGIGGVDALAAVAATAEHIDSQVGRVDVDVGLLGLRQHGNRGCRSVNPPLALGDGHALDTVDAGFEFQMLIGVDTVDGEGDFLKAADFVGTFTDQLQLIVVSFGPPGIHAVQFAGEQA